MTHPRYRVGTFYVRPNAPPDAALLARFLDERTALLDLGTADVHQPAAGAFAPGAPTDPRKTTMAVLPTKKRNALPGGKFALPDTRQYPINDAAHVRNAAARLEQMHKAGKISAPKYARAKRAIARAAKKFGIDSQYNARALADATGNVPDGATPQYAPPRTIRVKAQLGTGGSLSVRHLADKDAAATLESVPALLPEEPVTLSGDATTATPRERRPVWIQLATPGVFRGHPSGPFELNGRVFEQIIANFRALKNREIPIDYEHASEQDATSGTIPTQGAVATGWIRDMKLEAGNLWGLVYWNDRAAEQIRAGEYKYISPAIRFNTKDRVTGAAAGARLSSAALTNQPFLDGMAAVAAKDVLHGASGPAFARDAAGHLVEVLHPEAEFPAEHVLLDTPDGYVAVGPHDEVVLDVGEELEELPGDVQLRAPLARLAHSANEYMPKVRAALRLHDLASPADAADALGKLRAMYDDAGGDADATMNGVRLGDFGHPLRDLVGAAPGMSWEDVFKRVQALIDAAMVKHIVIEHGGGEEDELGLDATDDPTPMTAALMSAALNENDEEIMRILRSSTQATEAKHEDQIRAEAQAEAEERAGLKLQLKDVTGKVEEVTLKLRAAETEVSTLTLKLTEATSALDAAAKERDELRAYKADREEKDLQAEVDAAFLTWKDKKGLTDANKPHMLRLCKADPESFRAMYPAVSPEKQHLLKDGVVPPRDPQPPTQFHPAAPEKDATNQPKKISLVALTRQIAVHRQIPLAEAQVIALRMLRGPDEKSTATTR